MINQKTRILITLGCLVAAVIIILGMVLFSSDPADFWYCREGEWTAQGNPIEPMPAEDCFYD